MKNLKLVCFLFLFISFSCKKKDTPTDEPQVNPVVPVSPSIYKPGATVYGKNNYVKMIVGDYNSPIILSSPHDGTIEPSSMPVRDNADAVVVRDLYVSDLTMQISNSIYEQTGIRPHIIINDISRSRMEPNRSLAEAYNKSDAANSSWNEYHDFIKVARQIVSENVGKGLYIDMHGHGHTKNRIEVGYITSKTNLNAEDAVLDTYATSSSIYGIAKTSTYTYSKLVRGDYAFGTLLANEGCPAVPSKQDPKPNADDYFNGGYCTLTYGSGNGGTISAIQLETNGTNLRNTATQRVASGKKMANAIITYMKMHYNISLTK